MALVLNTEKATKSLKMSLEKRQILKPPVIDISLALDVSGSFDDEHQTGMTDDLITRLLPWGLVFDVDKKIELYTFAANDYETHVGDINDSNYAGYVMNNVVGKVPGYGGTTDYSGVLEKILVDNGWIDKRGCISRLFTRAKPKRKSLVFVVTDGVNDDHAATQGLLSESYSRFDDVYFLFIGISTVSTAKFTNIKAYADKFSNVGFVHVKDMKAFVNSSDDDINELFITNELISYLER